MNWTEQCVWITGASSGIGKASATLWAERGASVILSSRRQEALDEVVQGWSNEQRARSFILPLDLAEGESLPSKAQEALGWIGRIDVLVHGMYILFRKHTPCNSSLICYHDEQPTSVCEGFYCFFCSINDIHALGIPKVALIINDSSVSI